MARRVVAQHPSPNHSSPDGNTLGLRCDKGDAWTYDLTAFPNSTDVPHQWQYNKPTWPCEDPPFLDEIEEKGTGFQLTSEDQFDYNSWMAQAAHKRGLSIGLKNNGAQAKGLEPFYDTNMCVDARSNQFSLLIKRYDLQAWNLECSGF